MASNESVQAFLRNLNERYKAFRHALDEFLRKLASEDRNGKRQTVQTAMTELNLLKNSMSEHDRPPWIIQVEEALKFYTHTMVNDETAGFQLLTKIMPLFKTIDGQRWTERDFESTPAVDFSRIYAEFYKASRIPDLFDLLVKQMEDIIASGEIDSVRTIKALEKLIATIRLNSRKDYLATRGTWECSKLLLKNLVLEGLENTPGLKIVVKSIRKTMADIDVEMSEVTSQAKTAISQAIQVEIPMLTYTPTVGLIEQQNGDEESEDGEQVSELKVIDARPIGNGQDNVE